MQQKMQDRNQHSNHSRKQEGEVTIDYDAQKNSSSFNHNEGEYVDFEEVE